MQNKFIIDKEINLNEYDFLNTKIYADNLTKIINNSEPNKVFTIGLFGSWGTGKSSIIKTAESEFDQQKIKFITYDAWQYVNDSFRRMFLRKLREDLQYEEDELMKKFYENESTDVGNKYQLSPTRLAFILGGLCLLLAIIAFIPIGLDFKFPIYAIFTLLGLLITVVSGAFHQLKISVTKPHLFAPEQFEDCFKDIVKHSLKNTSWISKKWNWIVRKDNSIQNLEKLVIVIDNIDRCSNDVAYKLLTDIKTFLSSEPYNIVFIIPVDDEALKNHIIKSSKDNVDCKEKEEFLRKFFNVTIRIKPYVVTDMYAFAKQICEKAELELNSRTLYVASKEYAKNPRRIIQLFNNLLAELNYDYGEVDFANQNEILICCILIIREEYPAYYKEIVNSPKIFNEDYKGEDEKTKRFIRIAQNYLGKVEISDLSKILTNSHHHFSNVPDDVKDAIDTFDTETVLSIWENEKDNITDYIFDRFDDAISNEFIDIELVNLFDLMSKVNAKFPFETHFAQRIDEKIQPYFSTIISKTKNHQSLCEYALLRESQNNKTLKRKLIEESKRAEKQEKGTHWKSLFNAMLKVFQDKETSIALSSTYTLYYKNIEYQDFSENQNEYLISNEFVQQRIAELPRNESNSEILLNTEAEEYEVVKRLFENKKNITAETYATLFAKIIGADNSENRMRGKTTDEIADILKFANPLFSLIPDRKLTTQPQTLYNLIVDNRKMPHPNYPTHTQYDELKNFIDECISEEKYITEISDFVINAYRISSSNIDVNTEINKLLQYTYLHKEFIQLIDKGYNLQPILDTIFDNDTNSNSNENDRITVLKHCFNQKNNSGAYSISEEKARTKLNDLLAFAQKNKSTEVFTLFESLSEQERYKKLLVDLIVEKDSAFVNSLPPKLFKLAVSSFKRDNYNDFADNFEFLSVIIQNGTKAQKGYVISILTTKLNNDSDVDRVLSLIESMIDVPSFDSNGVLHSTLGKYQEDNEEQISEDVNKKIKQLKKKVTPIK
jgi:hypothetical protein